MKTTWTDERLRRLYAHYNRKYWAGVLPIYPIAVGALDGALGRCNWTEQLVVIDVGRHPADREVRRTVLHEMCHVAAGDGLYGGHHAAFFEQVERLLITGASVSVSLAEFGPLSLEHIPERFKLCRHKFKYGDAKFRSIIESAFPDMSGDDWAQYVFDMIVQFFEEAARQGISWEVAVSEVGNRSNMIDVDGQHLAIYDRWIGLFYERYEEAARADQLRKEMIRQLEASGALPPES